MNLRIGIIFISVFWISAVSLSCRKTDPPKASISVYDSAWVPVVNAKVIVYANPNGSYIDPQSLQRLDSARTNLGGEVTFTFKNKAIFQVKAEQYTEQYHRDGTKLLILEEGKTVSLKIQIK